MADGYFISSGTSHPDECWQWIAFLSEQLPARQIPPRRSLAESDAYVAQVGADVAAVARASLESAMLFSPRVFEFEDEIEALGEALYAAVNGDLPPQDALSMAQQRAGSQ
jgi:ABC-type glycerol-3-phosphate transport system substrate-binding protein